MYAHVKKTPATLGRMARSSLAALLLSFTVPGEFDHVVLLLLLLLGEHLLLGSQDQLRDAVEHLQEENRPTLRGESSDNTVGREKSVLDSFGILLLTKEAGGFLSVASCLVFPC